MFVTPGYAQETTPASGVNAEIGSHAASQEPEHGGSFPPFDSTYFPSQILWLAITFGLFYLLLSRVILPRLGNIIDTRRDKIAGDLDSAAKAKAEADAAVAAYEQELIEARSRANSIGQTARDEAKVKADSERKRIEGDLERRLGDAESRIRSIQATAMQDVGAIAEETTAAIVAQLGGGSVDRGEINAAVKAVQS